MHVHFIITSNYPTLKMVLRIWSQSADLPRPENPLSSPENNEIIYNLNSSEVASIHVPSKNHDVLMTTNNSGSVPYFEVVVVKDGFCYSIYRDRNSQKVKERLKLAQRVLIPFFAISASPPGNQLVSFHEFVGELITAAINHPYDTIAHLAVRRDSALPFIKKSKPFVDMINVQSGPEKETVLNLAIKSQEWRMVDAILSCHPDLTLKDAFGRTAMHAACYIREYDIFSRVLDEYIKTDRVVNYPEGPGPSFDFLRVRMLKRLTPLHVAAMSAYDMTLKKLFKLRLPLDVLVIEGQNSSWLNGERCKFGKEWRMKRVEITDKILNEDLDLDEVTKCGTILHWVNHRNSFVHFLKYEFPIDVPNVFGETPLHVMVRKTVTEKLSNSLLLLAFEANPNQRTRDELTPLHYAITNSQDISMIQALVVFGADLGMTTKAGNSLRHLTQEVKDPTTQGYMLWLLNSLGAARCSVKSTSCFQGCSPTGTMNGTPSPRWPSLDHETLYTKYFEPILEKVKKSKSLSGAGNILCCDGGGTKGIITCQILLELDKKLKRPIHEYFKWLAGTSTGSFIVSALALKKTPRDILRMYIFMKDRIMTGSKPYPADKLEELLKSFLGDGPMTDIKDVKLIIPAVEVDRKPAQLYLFRNYPDPDSLLEGPDAIMSHRRRTGRTELEDEKKLWFACRASGAAPTYFHRAEHYLDGGLIAPNPTLEALREYAKWNQAMKILDQPKQVYKPGIILSLGTGKWPILENKLSDFTALSWYAPLQSLSTMRDMMVTLGLIVTNTDSYVIERCQATAILAGQPYFRLNPPIGEQLPIDTTEDPALVNAMYEAKAYMHVLDTDITEMCNLLEMTLKT